MGGNKLLMSHETKHYRVLNGCPVCKGFLYKVDEYYFCGFKYIYGEEVYKCFHCARIFNRDNGYLQQVA